MKPYASLLLATLIFVLPIVHAQTPKPVEPSANYHTKSGIVYTQGAAGPLVADAYIPNGAGPFPGIVFIHGGGWIGGNRYQMVKLIKALATEGYIAFTIEYDVNPVHYPASFNQSLAAVRYFREHAAEFNLDPSRVAVAGSSAGGELAALVALTPDAKVQAAVILNGVLDLTALGDKSHMVTAYLGGPCTMLIDACKDASPISHIHPGAPPFFVGHGTADGTVPFAQAQDFTTALRNAKIQVRFFTATEGPHTYWAQDQFYAPNLEAIRHFLSLALRPRR
jgi:acetyl esterase/lipase